MRRKSYTLDSVLRDFNHCEVDFLKIDVQGAELEVMKGGTKTLRTATVVMLEVPFFGVYVRRADMSLRRMAAAPRLRRWICLSDESRRRRGSDVGEGT